MIGGEGRQSVRNHGTEWMMKAVAPRLHECGEPILCTERVRCLDGELLALAGDLVALGAVEARGDGDAHCALAEALCETEVTLRPLYKARECIHEGRVDDQIDRDTGHIGFLRVAASKNEEHGQERAREGLHGS